MIIHPRVNDQDVRILAIDPGEEHVGLAWGCRDFYRSDGLLEFANSPKAEMAPVWVLRAPGWRVVETEEVTSDFFIPWFYTNYWRFDLITAEDYRIYPDQAAKHIGRQVHTARMLGFIENVIRVHNQGHATPCPENPRLEIEFDSNMKSSTAPIPGIMKRLGVKPVSPRGASKERGSTGDHQRMAELHLWKTLIKKSLVSLNSLVSEAA